MSKLMPGQPVPDLSVAVIGDGRWTIGERRPTHFSMVLFYRGLHCPVCSVQLKGLDRRLSEFTERGVEAIAISVDGEDRAETTRDDWGLERLAIGYGLPIATARARGLYVSKAIKAAEPATFCEPGLFLVRPGSHNAAGALYWSVVSTMPFGRPVWDDVPKAIDFATTKNYPARGEL